MPAAVEQDALTDEQVEIVNDNLPLAYSLAFDSKELRIDLDDRRQAAALGLIEAVQTHDPEKGALATHAAWCIRGAIQRAARQARPMVSLDGMQEDGIEPAAPDDAPGLDAFDAERLRAIVVGLPDEARTAVVDRFYRGERPKRGRAAEWEDAALYLMRKATNGGRSIPEAVYWSDARTGEVVRPSRLSEADERAMRPMRLLPRFPVQALSTLSECAHKGPIPRGTLDYCPICDKSGQDGLTIPTDVKPLPVDKPKPPPNPEPKLNRKQRRAKANGKPALARKAG